ncbi:MAG: PqqD family peptide modification chaperone [Desulfobacterales bacterium]
MAKAESNEKNLLVRNPDVILREEDADGALLFNPDTNQIRVINPTGLFIWKQCDGKKDLPTIVAALKKNFNGVPEKEVDGEVQAFVDDMRANGFLGVPIGQLNPRGKKSKK